MRFKDTHNSYTPRVETSDRIRAIQSKACNICHGSGFHKMIEKQENGQEIEKIRQCYNCKGTGKLSI